MIQGQGHKEFLPFLAGTDNGKENSREKFDKGPEENYGYYKEKFNFYLKINHSKIHYKEMPEGRT